MNPGSGSPRRTARNLVPFVAASVLAWIAVPIGSSMDWGMFALSAGLAISAGVLRIVPLRGALTKAREAIPSLIFLIAVALLRDSAGGVNSAVGSLALLPVFYTALYSNRAQLCTVLGGMTAVLLAQNVLIGPPDYPNSQYRGGLIFIAVSAIIGLATQRLVTQARVQPPRLDTASACWSRSPRSCATSLTAHGRARRYAKRRRRSATRAWRFCMSR